MVSSAILQKHTWVFQTLSKLGKPKLQRTNAIWSLWKTCESIFENAQQMLNCIFNCQRSWAILVLFVMIT